MKKYKLLAAILCTNLFVLAQEKHVDFENELSIENDTVKKLKEVVLNGKKLCIRPKIKTGNPKITNSMEINN